MVLILGINSVHFIGKHLGRTGKTACPSFSLSLLFLPLGAALRLLRLVGAELHANLPKGTKTLPIAEWEQEYADLKTQRDSDYTKLKDTRTNVLELQKIRKCVDIALRADQPEQTQSRTKRHDIDR